MSWRLEQQWKDNIEIYDTTTLKPAGVGAWLAIEPMNKDDLYQMQTGRVYGYDSDSSPETGYYPITLDGSQNAFLEIEMDSFFAQLPEEFFRMLIVFDEKLQGRCAKGLLHIEQYAT